MALPRSQKDSPFLNRFYETALIGSNPSEEGPWLTILLEHHSFDLFDSVRKLYDGIGALSCGVVGFDLKDWEEIQYSTTI